MPEKFIDTIEQVKAQIIDRHISVTANAGSGKTTILKKRFIKIATKPGYEFDPRRIVAITFTRKAASEIFLRIAEEIDNLIESDIEGELKNTLAKIRAELKMSNISTIHTFCSGLIREFPIESGVNPNFSEMDEAEKWQLINDAVDTVIIQELKMNGNQALLSLIREYSRKVVFDAIIKILQKKELLDNINNFLKSNQNEDIFNIYINEIKGLIEKLFFEIDNELLDLIVVDAPEDKQEFVKSFLDKLYEFCNCYNKYSAEDLFKELNSVKILADDLSTHGILTQSFSISRRTFRKSQLKDNESLKKSLAKISELLKLSEIITVKERSFNALDKSRLIFDLALKAYEYMNEEKFYNNILDFDDLIIKTRDLLSNEEIAKKIRAKYDFIMIDEFQDTNYLQYDIVKALIPELKDVNLNSNLNLFIVGDPKQSIYGFRNADVRVFKEATNDIKTINKNKRLSDNIQSQIGNLELNEDEKLGEMSLSVSFRHSPVISLFVNKVCSTMMEEQASEFDVHYNELICSQKSKELEQLKDNISISNYKLGSVNFIIRDIREKEIEKYQQSEYERIAIFIKKIIDERYLNEDYKYSDIAILSRKTKKIPDMIAALQKYGIPYEATGSRGFFLTPEINDLVSILKFLNNKYNNKALLATLRSIFFPEFPYELFLNLGAHQGYYWDILKDLAEEKNNDIILHTYKTLEKLLELSTKLPIPHLILKIFEHTFIEALLNRFIAKNQMLANLQKFIRISRDFVNKGFKNLHDFVNHIDFILNNDIDEEEELLISENDAVNILTIHKAKGLEFKIVVLMDTLSSGSGGNNLIFDDKLGVVLKDKVSINNYETELKENIFTFVINKKAIFKELAEDKRLIYVALTRAKEHLIISGSFFRNNANNYLNEILKSFNIDVKTILDESTSEINCEGDLKYFNQQEIKSKHIGFKMNIYTDDLEFTSSNRGENKENDEQLEQENPIILLEPIKSSVNNELISATRLLKYKEGEIPYLRRYLLGFEEDYEYESVIASEDEILARDFGSMIHYTFEKIDNWFDEIQGVDLTKLKRTIISAASAFFIPINDDLINNSIFLIKQVLETKLIKKFKHLIKNSLKEYEVYMPYQDDYLIAKIDFLLRENETILEIWDWKTSKVDNIDDMINVAKKYEIQMKLYAYVLRNLVDKNKRIKTRLLFTNLAKPDLDDNKWTILYEWTEDDLNEFEDELTKSIIKIKEIV